MSDQSAFTTALGSSSRGLIGPEFGSVVGLAAFLVEAARLVARG